MMIEQMIALGTSPAKMAELREWKTNHECTLTIQPTLGETTTYCITPTGLGYIYVVKCACGSSINVTDFSDW